MVYFLDQFPLVLASAKSSYFCHSQHRSLPSVRVHERDPIIEIHPETAKVRGIFEQTWVILVTPVGSFKAKAHFRENLDQRVVFGRAGWWQACSELELKEYDTRSAIGVNFNSAIGGNDRDPISGSVSHKSYLCEVRPYIAD